jgi:hypothetical protein
VTLRAVPASTAGLRSGGVSITLHVASQQADEAFRLHRFQGQTVTVDIYVDEEE